MLIRVDDKYVKKASLLRLKQACFVVLIGAISIYWLGQVLRLAFLLALAETSLICSFACEIWQKNANRGVGEVEVTY